MDALDNPDWTGLAAGLADLAVRYGVRTLGALALMVAIWSLGGWASRALRFALQGTRADKTVSAFLVVATRWSIRALGVVLCMSVFGIETTSLAALLGGAGVAVGVALKGNLANLASGLVLLVFRPFRHGDWIEVGDHQGRVAHVSLLHTQIDGFDGSLTWIPNSDLLESSLTNHDHRGFHRVDLEVGVAYDSDLKSTTEVLTRVAATIHHPDSDHEVVVRAVALGGSSIDFLVGPWVPSTEVFQARHDLIVALKGALDEADIEIPFPQRVLHLRSLDDVPHALAAK